MAQESPLGGAEEGMGLYVRCPGTRSYSAELILDEEFANKGFTETRGGKCFSLCECRSGGWAYFEICGAPECSGKGTSSRSIFANVAFRFLPLNGVVPNSIS